MPRRTLHRRVFVVAGVYNVAWGIYSSLDPQWLFRVAGMLALNHPEIFACLAMVVGLYGVLYLEVVWVPERGWLLAAVGLGGQGAGSARPARANGYRPLALVGARPLPDQRLHLVDSVWSVPAECLPVLPG